MAPTISHKIAFVIKMPPVPGVKNTVAMVLRNMLGNCRLVSVTARPAALPFQAQMGLTRHLYANDPDSIEPTYVGGGETAFPSTTKAKLVDIVSMHS